MKRNRGDKSETKPSPAPRPDARQYLLAALTALLVATPLVPAEAVVRYGTGCVLAMAWTTLLLVWAVVRAVRRGQGAGLRVGWPLPALLLIVAWHFAGTWVNWSESNVRAALNVSWQWVTYAAAYFLVRQLAVFPRERRALCAVMLGLCVCLSAHGLHQYFVSLPRQAEMYRIDPEGTLDEAGLDAPVGSPLRSMFESRLATRQPFATFGLENSLAGMLTPWLVIAGAIVLFDHSLLRGSKKTFIGTGLIVVMTGTCLILTGSRTAVLSTLLGLLLASAIRLVIRRGESTRRRVVMTTLLVIAFAVTLPVLAVWTGAANPRSGHGWLDAMGPSGRSVEFRLQYWWSTARMIGDHPWFGSGPGNFQENYTLYKLADASESIADPHNFLLELASTAGIPAALAMVALLACVGARVSVSPTEQDPTSPFDRSGSSVEASSRKLVYVGGCLGILVGMLNGMLVGFEVAPVVLWLGLPAGAIATLLLDRWVSRGHLPPTIYLIAAGALLINLTAAGGINYASVAQSGWLLAALGVNAAAGAGRERELRGRIALLVPLFGLLALACALTNYLPVMQSRQRLLDGQYLESQGEYQAAEAAYVDAAERDPRSPRPWLHLAANRLSRWQREPTSANWRSFARSVDEAIRRNPRSSALRGEAGNWYLTAHASHDEPRALPAAVACYEAASELNPRSAILHAQLAWSLWLTGDGRRASQESREALRLDALMPAQRHPEHKLRAQRLVSGTAARNALPPLDLREATAEQVMLRLRTATSRGGGE